jgi:3-deoxy-7-phosphoheptulonate synthase
MVVELHDGATAQERVAVEQVLTSLGAASHPTGARPAADGVYATGAHLSGDDYAQLAALPGVARVVQVATPYVLASRAYRAEPTVVRVGTVTIGAGEPVVIAGPCAIESEAQIADAARAARDAGAQVLRGGAFKPRTSPYSFQGLGLRGVELLAQAGAEVGLPIVTEVMEPGMVPAVAALADVLQIGSRNMQNFPLLRAAGQSGRPVLLKRGFAATIEEWLLAAEYVLAEGNPNVILCERGIRGFDPQTRNVLDLACVPLLHQLTHLPVIVDPSHATGRRELVAPMGLAAIAAGADGLIIEMHTDPDAALSDAAQTIDPATLRAMIAQARALREALAAQQG